MADVTLIARWLLGLAILVLVAGLLWPSRSDRRDPPND